MKALQPSKISSVHIPIPGIGKSKPVVKAVLGPGRDHKETAGLVSGELKTSGPEMRPGFEFQFRPTCFVTSSLSLSNRGGASPTSGGLLRDEMS